MQVFDHLGSADRPSHSTYTTDIDFIDVPGLLRCMGEDLKK